MWLKMIQDSTEISAVLTASQSEHASFGPYHSLVDFVKLEPEEQFLSLIQALQSTAE